MTALPGFTAAGELDVTSAERPGATVVDGGVRFEVWAPAAERVEVVVEGEGGTHRLDLTAGPAGLATFVGIVPGLRHGARYRYALDGGEALADPLSRFQPDGVAGPSAVVYAGGYEWTDGGWRGVALEDTVLYELHVGTFTPEGTLDAAIAELPRLVALGVTTIELLPLAQFSGRRGWGYDGVFLSAVQHSYGGPDALARFVDAAHALGLAVVVDAVFNHFGPEGNVTHHYGPYVTETYATPWGGAVNVSEAGSDQVRRAFVDVARWWIEDMHCDGLRLDAVHAIVDPTARPFLEELNTAVHSIGERLDRTVLTFLESAANDPRMVTPPPDGIGGDAVWDDEFHHAIRVSLTGDRSGYYVDFTGPADVADVLANGFAYRGRYSPARGRRHGRDVSHIDRRRFVVFDQNHDQIGNRRDGERLGMLVGLERRKLALAAVLLSPFTPMLFMGEEYGDPAPFPFFVDHQDPELLEAVRRGRAEEFAAFEWEGEPPDPGAVETFESAVLDPSLATTSPHRELLALTTELLRLRRAHPVLTDPGAEAEVAYDDGVVTMRRRLGTADVLLALNFTDAPTPLDAAGRSVVITTSDERWAGPGTTAATLAPWSTTFLA